MSTLLVRPIARSDYAQWRILWDGYNAFYGRVGPTALAQEITQATRARMLYDDVAAHSGFVVYAKDL